MMGAGAPGEIADMLTLCDRGLPQDVTGNVIWIKEGTVTGFKGPFEGIPENSSSIVIDELEEEGVDSRVLAIVKLELSDQEVSQKIPQLWREKFRSFAIHFAPHSVKNRIYVEQRAPSERGEIVNEMSCNDVAKEVNEKCGLNGEKYGGLKVETSGDSVIFIDGSIYFIPLDQSPWNTYLVKVPPIEGECTKEAILEVVRAIIEVATTGA